MTSPRTFRIPLGLTLAIALASLGRAAAEPVDSPFTEHSYQVVDPAPGVARAQIGDKPAWCDAAKLTDQFEPRLIARTMKNGVTGISVAALQICQRPTDPTWKVQAGYILQAWMNLTYLPQPEAEQTLRQRIQKQKILDDKRELCNALTYSPELGGEAKAFGAAYRLFFGCDEEKEFPLWSVTRPGTEGDVGYYLDANAQPKNELLRMYWLFHFTMNPERVYPSKDPMENRQLVLYAASQVDFDRLDPAQIERELQSPPWNDYARLVARESAGVLKGRQRLYEESLTKMIKDDPDYTRILRDAPKQAYAEWEANAAKWKAELARSAAFEAKLSAPSHRGLKGCAPALHKDAEAVVRSWKLYDWKELRDKVRMDPFALLLLSRLSVCDAVDEIHGTSGAFRDLVVGGKELRGPRSVALQATLEAIADARNDRPRLLLVVPGFAFRDRSLPERYAQEFTFDGADDYNPEERGSAGIVGAITKVTDGTFVTFKATRIAWPVLDCKDTSKPLRILSDGRIEYQQSCRPTGRTRYQDTTPAPVVLSPGLEAQVKPGVYLVAWLSNARAKNGQAFAAPVFVKRAQADKRLIAYYGFDLGGTK